MAEPLAPGGEFGGVGVGSVAFPKPRGFEKLGSLTRSKLKKGTFLKREAMDSTQER